MLKIGLTGGIGSGKSAVSARFEELGVPVIDTDVIARQLVTPGSSALEEIVNTFGSGVLTEDGELDRKALGRAVFDDKSLKYKLESILHPRIKDETLRQVRKIDAPYCVLVVPLLLETNFVDLVDKVLVVDAPKESRLVWVSKRDGLSNAEIKKIMAVQSSREERLDAADFLIENDGSIDQLRDKVDVLHRDILRRVDH